MDRISLQSHHTQYRPANYLAFREEEPLEAALDRAPSYVLLQFDSQSLVPEAWGQERQSGQNIYFPLDFLEIHPDEDA